MSSSGLKRPQEFEMANPTSGSSPNGPVANGSKRRCINLGSPIRVESHVSQNSSYRDSKIGPNVSHSSSFRDPNLILTPVGEEIASMIKEEIHRSGRTQIDNKCLTNESNGDETPVLTVRQAQVICERLIKDREYRLREEYDRTLACKIAEQYDLIAKANYINSYVEPRLPPTPGHNPSINALAAAFTSMQRSAASATSQAPPMPDLSTFAASLTANGHPSALATQHLAYNLQQQAATAAAMQAQQQRIPSNNNPVPSGPVLLVSNIDEQLANPEDLFTLFGVFGDVIRVKILFNKKDNALIQMADANQAQVAQGYLDKQRVFGKNMRVTRSKHQLVQMPREGNQSDVGLTKDFTNSPLHRFKIPGSRNYLNIYPPSNTLHISNIPATTQEEDIHKAFKEACGFEFCSFKFFPKDRKMALIKFNSIEHATIALIKMHNYPMSPDNNLRVSFSKSAMQP